MKVLVSNETILNRIIDKAATRVAREVNAEHLLIAAWDCFKQLEAEGLLQVKETKQ